MLCLSLSESSNLKGNHQNIVKKLSETTKKLVQVAMVKCVAGIFSTQSVIVFLQVHTPHYKYYFTAT